MAKITRTLTNQRLLELEAALVALDGCDKIVKDGERERVVKDFYKLGGGLRMSMAKNRMVLKAALAAHELARQAAFKEASDGADSIDSKTDEGRLQLQKLNSLMNELAQQTHEVELLTLTQDELRLDQNPVPIDVLVGLGPILEELQDKPEAAKPAPRDPSPSERAAERALKPTADAQLETHLAAKTNGKAKRAAA